MPFCRSVVFLITTFKFHPARGTQQTDTKKLTAQLCQSAGYQLPGDARTLHLRGLINNQQDVSLLGRLFPHWTLSLRPPVSHLPFLVTQSERARPCSGIQGSVCQNRPTASSAWGTAPGKDPFLILFFEEVSFLVAVLPRGAAPPTAAHICQHLINFLSEIETVVFIWSLPVLLIDYKHWCGVWLVMVLITKDFRSDFQLPAYAYLIKIMVDFRVIFVKCYFPLHF